MERFGEDDLALVDAWWRAANYLSAAQLYLLDNPLLRETLTLEHIKPRLLGHWGTTPGLNFIYVHLNRLIKARDLSVLFVAGPGHGAPGLIANAYLEGTYSELYPDVSQDAEGMRRLVRQFSFPGGIPSHAAPQTPGSIHEGGELGYSLSHAYGAVLDNPGLIAACVVGDGEAETGPLATSWHCNKFIDPAADGAVLPVLHLNGYKIANPTVLARIPRAELASLLAGYGHAPIFVEGDDPGRMHQAMAGALGQAFDAIRDIQEAARTGRRSAETRWPMIVLRSSKGWTGPKEIDGKRIEGTFRAHQIPIEDLEKPAHLSALDAWLRSYDPQALFGDEGRLRPDIAALAPVGPRRMSANPHSNGGAVLRPLRLPDFAAYAVAVAQPGTVEASATGVAGAFLRDVMRDNAAMRNFRLVGPDETASNKLQAVFEATDRTWDAATVADDDHLSPHGRVMEILSEHTCQGWLEGYLLTGRHGLFSCYEAFIHIVDSMVNQHAKWIKTVREVPWRREIASLNYLLTSHVWRQDHNGFSHQDPGFIDHVGNKKADTVRVYLPPDANTLLCVTDHCLRSRDKINVIVAGKQPEAQWLDMDSAIRHCAQGISIWQWASNDAGGEPDVVMACAGDVPTLETLAATSLLRRHLPDLKVRVVNVVDLMALQPRDQHPHGLSDGHFDALFTRDKPVIFAYHGYPWLIHRLAYRRANHDNLHVRGYMEEGTTTTPFDMVVRNRLDRYHLVCDVIERVPGLAGPAGYARQAMNDALTDHGRFIVAHGIDMPEGARLALAWLMILTLNAGSSSLKFALFHRDGGERLRGEIEGIGKQPKFSASDATGQQLDPPDVGGNSHEQLLGGLLHWVEAQPDTEQLAAVGHRVVHGGEDFAEPVRIDDEVLTAIEALVPLAPLHQPHNIAAIRAVARERPGLPQVGCFDTAFHRTLPAVARRVALPREFGARRYGFHGLSYEFVAGRLADLAPGLAAGRVIVAHLGSGASLCALAAGRSIATTMGFSALDGLMMGTRPGSLDPGVILYLMQSRGLDAAAIEDLLYHKSGLLGVSGISSDMRDLRSSDAPAARDALELFSYRIASETGALASCLGGLDGFVFTGGIGEHDAAMRLDVCRRLAWLGVAIDPARQAAGQGRISLDNGQVAVWVIPTDEEAVIAQHTARLVT